jgi:predicted  nucleic acid-binding Zn-ribbon protein
MATTMIPIDKLLQLDSYDRDLGFLLGKAKRLPEELQGALEAVAEANREKDARHDELQKEQVAANALDVEFKTFADRLDKLAAQLNIAKSNAEYKGVENQIGVIENERSDVEEKALMALEMVDEKNTHVAAAQGVVKEKEKLLTEKQAEVDREVEKAKKEADELAAKRNAFAAEISQNDPDSVLSVYEKTLERRKDSALAKASNDFRCMKCFMRLRPQEYNLVLIGETLVRCQSCSRILYQDPDEK